MKDRNFEIKIRSSDLSSEEKRKLLWSSFDTLFSNNQKINKKSFDLQKNDSDGRKHN